MEMEMEVYQELFQNCQSVMLIVAAESGHILDANRAACDFYGYPAAVMKTMTIHAINTLPEDQIRAEMQKATRGRRNGFIFQHRLASGVVKDVEVFTGPVSIGSESVLYSIVHDISERRDMERQIAIEKKFSESLISSLPGVMYVFNQLGQFSRWNKNLEIVTGYTPEEIRKMTPLDFIAPDGRQRVGQAIERVFLEGKASVEASFATRSGQIIPHLLTGYRFVQKGLNYLVGIGLDISERVATEQEKENLIEQLQHSLARVKKLSGLLPICASCKNIRDDKGYWKQIELYIKDHSEAEFSHSICPDCAGKLYPGVDRNKLK